jgi:DNA-binding NarL/FixJ family response regulator
MEKSPTRVAIVEDSHEIREGLGFLIHGTEGFTYAGGFGSMEEALQKLRDPLPHIILLDLELPGMSGIEGARAFRDKWPEVQIIILTVYEDDDRIFRALCAGASGYLLKKTSPAKLIDHLHECMAGGAVISPEVAGKVISIFRKFQPPEHADYHLTPHELRLLKMLVEGHTRKCAAAELGSSVHTVSFHMRNIYRKLEVHSRSKAVARALQDKLV